MRVSDYLRKHPECTKSQVMAAIHSRRLPAVKKKVVTWHYEIPADAVMIPPKQRGGNRNPWGRRGKPKNT